MKCSMCENNVLTSGLCGKHYQRMRSTRPGRPTRDMTVDQRFDFYVTKTGMCWLWTGATFGPDGYGAFYANGKTIGAHTYAYRRAKGDTGALWVLHTCDTRRCVNPDHLFLGTPKDNTDDLMAKGRGKWPRGSVHHLAKLSDADVERIRELGGAMTQKEIARMFSVDPSHISRLLAFHPRGRVR